MNLKYPTCQNHITKEQKQIFKNLEDKTSYKYFGESGGRGTQGDTLVKNISRKKVLKSMIVALTREYGGMDSKMITK